MARWLIARLFLLILLFSACSEDDDQDNEPCPFGLAIGLSIEVIDSATGTFVAEGIRVRATEGFYTEDLLLGTDQNENQSYLGAVQRPGTYRITITGELYETFSSELIEVSLTEDGCRVSTEHRTFEIAPL